MRPACGGGYLSDGKLSLEDESEQVKLFLLVYFVVSIWSFPLRIHRMRRGDTLNDGNKNKLMHDFIRCKGEVRFWFGRKR